MQGYSRFCQVLQNNISSNRWNGIAIDHGQDNSITANLISDNGEAGRLHVLKWSPSYGRYRSGVHTASPSSTNGILLWTDETDPYPALNFTCLRGYDHKPSRNYTISNNFFENNGNSDDQTSAAISLQNTTDSIVFNNVIMQNNTLTDFATSIGWTHSGNQFSLSTRLKQTNAIGGKYSAGNFYANYYGCDKDGDGLGDTPYSNSGLMSPPDQHPLTNTRC